MKTSFILKKARALIKSRRERYICCAINTVLKEESGFAWEKRGLIMGMLEGCGTLEIWLNTKHGIPYGAMTVGQMRLYRLRWLDHLIAQYKAKGD